MKKFLATLLAVCTVLALCAGCGSKKEETPAASESNETPAASTETVVLRLANSHNAEHITSQACQMFADLVNEKTDGRITIECHFPVSWATSAPPSSSASSAAWTSPVYPPAPPLSSLPS